MSGLFHKKRARYEKDEFEAYGEYSYDYLYAAKQDADGQPDEGEPRPAAPMPAPRARARRAKNGWLVLLCALAAITVALIVITETMFKLQTVCVIGCVNKTPQEVVMASGLSKGQSIFSVSEDDVQAALKSDFTIVYKGMKKDYPSTVYLYIEERTAVAVMRWLGVLYLLDEEGLVMEQRSGSELPTDMPIVTGFNLSNLNEGQRIMVRNGKQLEAYTSIMRELRLQMYTRGVTEINLANPSDILLITAEGVSARLGDGKYMQAKICALRTYMAYLRQLGKCSGTLDVSIPEDAKYTPER